MAIEVELKQWGNSIGVIIPKNIINSLKARPGEKILIEVERKENPLKELFGALKFTKPTSQLLKEARKGMESKWM